ncbi:hypothetical protein D9O36_15630 [Zobellia amurskyensis]|uniref:Uncharacterized protein n=1 Tax=Zobellia amurskyensis TaxID=248905 RepID=A0A7X3D397_9FLAO|nr:hypothetical protein [Zobellia amurskyensis]MUH37281.1 hypothetical protein [Zobellia amurskyensis]
MKNIGLVILLLLLGSCVGEVKEKLTKAKAGVSNASTFVKEARKVEGRIEKLKNAVPLTNEQLKEWLPQNLGPLERTGFKVGQAGMYQVNSVEGTYKKAEDKKTLSVMIIDGAGPTGSMMATSYGLLGNFEMETEDEYKHQQTVEINGIKAQQIYKKKSNDTQLMFAYEDRFLVTINANDMLPEETWGMVDELKLEQLTKMTE